MTGDNVLMEIDNYAASGDESVVREITFGPASTEFALLIEVDPYGGPLRVTVGNGPLAPDLPELLPEVLRDMASAIEKIVDSEEFWDQLVAR